MRAAGRENLFRREGEYWTIAYHGTVLRLRDTKGLRYLASLLRHPGERFAARDLISQAATSDPQTLEAAAYHFLDADAERARLAVTKRVKAAIKRIAEHDASLGHYLATTIKTGQQCAYLPDPAQPVEWEE